MKELQLNDDFVYNNEEEAEMGQLHAIHNNMNAIANVRNQLAKQAAEPSLEECEECGDEIPQARRLAIPGCRLCIFCKQHQERR